VVGRNVVGRQRFKWRGAKCNLVDNDGVFIAKGQMAACDPQEIILDDQLDEDHVELCIWYYPGIVSIVMTIWKWSLAQTILDKYPLRKHIIAFNETHILGDDDVGAVGVKKK
jgi:hypothetical protein